MKKDQPKAKLQVQNNIPQSESLNYQLDILKMELQSLDGIIERLMRLLKQQRIGLSLLGLELLQ